MRNLLSRKPAALRFVNHSRRWLFTIQTTIARDTFGPKDARLSFKTKDRAVNIWFAGEHAGVVYQVARGKIVRAVDDHVIVDEQPQRVLAGQTGLVSFDLDVRIDVLETILRRSDLGAPDVLGAVNDLSL